MPDVELEYESRDVIPTEFAHLYLEKDNKFVLCDKSNFKTDADVEYVREALRKEREDHKVVKESVKAWEGLNPDEVRPLLAKIPELEAAAEGKLDEGKIETIVASRLAQQTGPLQRKLEEATEKLNNTFKENDELKNSIVNRDKREAITAAAAAAEVRESARGDAVDILSPLTEFNESGKLISKDNGLEITDMFKEQFQVRPHWWPESQGGGARGQGVNPSGFSGANPWTNANWNMTQQGALLNQYGKDVAERMAKAAGTTVGGSRPQK